MPSTLRTLIPALTLLLSSTSRAAPAYKQQGTSLNGVSNPSKVRDDSSSSIHTRDQGPAPQPHALLADLPHAPPALAPLSKRSSGPLNGYSITTSSPAYAYDGDDGGDTSAASSSSTSTTNTSSPPSYSSSLAAVAAAPSSSTPTAFQPDGTLTINNHCAFPIYLWTIGDASTAAFDMSTAGMTTLQPFTGRTTAPYRARADNIGGISVKISRDMSLLSDAGTTPVVSQFEYTANPSQTVWYDWSNVDGNAFADSRVVIHPLVDESAAGGAGAAALANCVVVDCPPGGDCEAAYTVPEDNYATHACPAGTDLVVELCAL